MPELGTPPPPRRQLLLIEDLALSCRIGVGAAERATPQRLLVTLEVEVEPAAPRHDRLIETVDYGAILRALRRIAAAGEVRLLETLAQRFLPAIFADPRVRACTLTLRKPDLMADAAAVGLRLAFDRPPG